MKVELASCGNPDHYQDPYQPMYGCESNHFITIDTLEEASKECRKFIENYNLGGGNWIGGKVYENGKCIAEISLTGKIMPPSPKHESKRKGMAETKRELIAIGDVPQFLEEQSLELAKAYFKKNNLSPFTCFEAMSALNNPELEYHWLIAQIEANKALISHPQYQDSEIYLTCTTVDK